MLYIQTFMLAFMLFNSGLYAVESNEIQSVYLSEVLQSTEIQ